jgi:hypothetical protein
MSNDVTRTTGPTLVRAVGHRSTGQFLLTGQFQQENALLVAFDRVVLLVDGDAASRAIAAWLPQRCLVSESKCRTAQSPIDYRSQPVSNC